MLTDQGKIQRLSVWAKDSSPKYLMLLAEPPNSASTLETVVESEEPGNKSYQRQKISPNEWSIPTLGDGAAVITSAEKSFGPFVSDVPVTHVALCSVETGTKGILYLYSPIESYIKTKEARVFTAGEVFMIRLEDRQQ